MGRTGGPVIVHVMDAHALVWMLEGNARLGSSARAVLSDPESSLVLPAIALAEACWVVSKGRTSLAHWRHVIEAVLSDHRIRIVGLDAGIIELAMSLPVQFEMHDAQIIATALIERENGTDIRLLTRDQAIVASDLVSVIW